MKSYACADKRLVPRIVTCKFCKTDAYELSVLKVFQERLIYRSMFSYLVCFILAGAFLANAYILV
jgi:hypothetical protein